MDAEDTSTVFSSILLLPDYLGQSPEGLFDLFSPQ
jgi:hypothetical protein